MTLTRLLGGNYTGTRDTLTKVGSGTLTLTDTSAFDNFVGKLAINAGTVAISDVRNLGLDYPDFGSVLSFGGGTLRTTATLTAGHPVTLASGGGTLEVASGTTLTLTGNITGTNTLTKTGAGTLKLSGASTGFSGNTAISFGTIETGHVSALGSGAIGVSGSTARLNLAGFTIANAITVEAGGIVQGSGGVGALTLSGGNVSPGASPDTMTAGATAFGASGGYTWEINNATGTVGTNWDLLNITGTLTVASTSGSPFTISLLSLTTGNAAGQVINFNNTQSYSYTIATASSGLVGYDSSKISLNTSGFQNDLGGGSWSLSAIGNNLNLNFTPSAIPEPGTYAAIAGGAMLAFAAWRRRRTRTTSKKHDVFLRATLPPDAAGGAA